MSGTAYPVIMVLEPLAHCWRTWALAPQCECCGQAVARGLCWFSEWFAFTACGNCAEQIARQSLLAVALTRGLTGLTD